MDTSPADDRLNAPSDQIPNVVRISEILKTKEWLDGQNYDLSVALQAEKLNLPATDNVEELQERISQLQVELYKVSTDQVIKELILKKAQCNQVLSEKLFSAPLPSSGQDGEAAESDQRKFAALMQEQKKITSAILVKEESVSRLQKELDAVRKRNFELKENNRRMMGVIKQHRMKLEKAAEEVKRNAACRGLKDELESTVSRIEIAKSTLQALIVGSGVNWAQDPDLLETVLLCGDAMNF